MSALAGFLVVRTAESAARGEARPHRLNYHGVDRVPPHPTDDEAEAFAVDEYVFGDYKDEESNVIPCFDAAVRLLRLFSSSSKYEYELVYCCEDLGAAQAIERDGVAIEPLGYDVANVLVGYWSIVAGMPRAREWATPFRKCLGEFGLFSRREDAEAYYREYCDRREEYCDDGFDVVCVFRVVLGEKH